MLSREKKLVADGQGEALTGLRYILLVLLISASGILGLSVANRSFAPEMYSRQGPVEIAEALAAGQNYTLFDLNVNIREIRDAQIARMPTAPELAILGASHWQEAHMDLLPGIKAYNSHVHRDYYEDMLGVTEMFVRHNKLPKKLVISLRDNLFTPIANRKDHLWLPGIPYYRQMAKRLGLTEAGHLETLPVARWREVVSAQMLFENVTRWFNAEEWPHATPNRYFKTLDTLLPDGSIIWSREHRALFTQKRSRALSVAFAKANADAPPQIDPKGVEDIEALIRFLIERDVEVILAKPPFNPIYFDLVRHTPYMEGLKKVEALATRLASTHGLRIVGSFDPAEVGCDASMYIDAEHSNSACLGRIMQQILRNEAPQAAQVVASNEVGPKFDFRPSPAAAKATIAASSRPVVNPDVPQSNAGRTSSEPRQPSGKHDDLALRQRAIEANSRGWGVANATAAQAESKPASVEANADDIALQQLAILANARMAIAKKPPVDEAEIPKAAIIAGAPSIDSNQRSDVRQPQRTASASSMRPEPLRHARGLRLPVHKPRRVPVVVRIQQGWPGDPVHVVVRYQPVSALTN